MSHAIERLAAELRTLSTEEWAQLPEHRSAGQDINGAFGQASDAEISGCLCETGQGTVMTNNAGKTLAGAPSQALPNHVIKT